MLANLLLFNLNLNFLGWWHLSEQCVYCAEMESGSAGVREAGKLPRENALGPGGLACFPAHTHLPGRSVCESVSSKFQER